ncbi:MAG TPA: methyltransferase domain-containing protein [Candidatus Thioglobus sp.]|jgi:ubiquinone/menaquinone biosynthesis C-methylase UbiE|nr:methyltransferase domain-containing protein [Candidatus Thioglobus sp.]
MASLRKMTSSHYRRHNLEQLVRAALNHAKQLNKPFDHKIIAAVDQFHIGGLAATLKMIELAGFNPQDKVLDVGCGIGGAARTIACTSNCHVTGVDLSEDYCQAARLISKQLNMGNQTKFIRANALKMPFKKNSYSALWTQHITMNICDKKALMTEFYRVLKPAGQLLMYEVLCTTRANDSVNYPLPWAKESKDSFLDNIHNYGALIHNCGFELNHLQDVSSTAIVSIQRVIERIKQGGKKEPGLEIILGESFLTMMENLLEALQNDRLSVVEFVATKPSTPN